MSYILNEDFTGAAGTLPSSGIWNIRTGAGAPTYGANDKEYYTNNTGILYQDGGSNLIMRVGQTGTFGATSGLWPSARLDTQGNYALQDGQSCEIKVKISPLQGLWPADWFAGATATYPSDWAEIDMQESGDNNGGTYNISATSFWTSGPTSLNGDATYTPSINYHLDGNFHTYRLDMTSSQLEVFIDGVLYAKLLKSNIGGNAWNYDTTGGMYVILNVAVAPGNGFGTPNAAQLPWISQTVDYVRIWSPNGPDPNSAPPVTGITQHERLAGQAVKLASIY